MGDVAIRRLGPGDEAVLELLDREDADFDAPGRGGPRGAVRGRDAEAYLADPAVLHWVAQDGADVVGHLLCYVQPRRRGDARQVLVYELGVRTGRRGEGIGRALLDALDAWMDEHGVRAAWVPADPDVEAFYSACGFERHEDQPVQLVRRR